MIREILLVGTLCLALAGCSAGSEPEQSQPQPPEAAPLVLEQAGPLWTWSELDTEKVQSAELFYYSGEGEQAESRLVFGTELEALLEELEGIEAPAAAGYEPPEERCALYGVRLIMTDRDYEGISCGDRFLTNDGGVFQLSGDFLKDAWESATEEIREYPFGALPALRELQMGENGWRAAFLPEDLDSVGETVTMDLTAQDGEGVTFTLTNHGGGELTYGAYTALEAEVDGRWYAVAPTLTHYAWDSIAYILAPGMTSEPETVPLAVYEPLPEGRYRLVKTLGETRCAAEFELKR